MDRDAVLALFDRYGDMVYRVALGYLRSPSEAEDVVQEVFLKLLEGRAAVYPGKERPFLVKIAVNRCKDILRAARRRGEVPLEELTLLAPPEERELFRAVLELPEKYRNAVILHHLEGYSLRETAQILRVSPSAVSMRLFRAKEILREQIGRER